MTKIFLSVGATYTPEQEAFVTAFETFLSQNGCERLTVGRGSETAHQPVVAARDRIESADGTVVIAFTRTVIANGAEKPGSSKPKEITNARYPTIWNQLEAAMAFGLKKPLLVIIEEGLEQEAMLKDRMEYRALVTPLDAGYFRTDVFKGIFADWTRLAREKTAKRLEAVDPTGLTIGQIIKNLKPGELWTVLGALFALLSAVAVAGYWIGKNLPETSDTTAKPAAVQPLKNP